MPYLIKRLEQNNLIGDTLLSKYNIITNNKNWMETTAINQLKHISTYKGVIQATGLPDLHAGRSPVGIAVITQDYIYPYLLGSDIGCGMGLFDTGIGSKKFKMEKWQSKLNNIRELGDIESVNPYIEECPIHDLGTIGGGNHFAEFQKIETVFNEEEWSRLNVDNNILLLIHSGSRAYGQQIMNNFTSETGYETTSQEAKNYLKLHDNALLWAKRNRFVVANKLINWLGYASEAGSLVDCNHNFIEEVENSFIHRKGAVSSTNGLVIIPGSRGTLTYIVKPTGDKEMASFSLSHGAGRKWARSLCKSRIKNKYDRNSIRHTALKSRVVCHDTELLYQEAPEAYKNIGDIINVLLEYNLIEIVATLRPLITYKG